MSPAEMLVAWSIQCGDVTALVYEDGTVESVDPALRQRLLFHLTEAVDVSHSGAGGRPMVLKPGDRRYVVARVRKLVAEAGDLQILGVQVSGQ